MAVASKTLQKYNLESPNYGIKYSRSCEHKRMISTMYNLNDPCIYIADTTTIFCSAGRHRCPPLLIVKELKVTQISRDGY